MFQRKCADADCLVKRRVATGSAHHLRPWLSGTGGR